MQGRHQRRDGDVEHGHREPVADRGQQGDRQPEPAHARPPDQHQVGRRRSKTIAVVVNSNMLPHGSRPAASPRSTIPATLSRKPIRVSATPIRPNASTRRLCSAARGTRPAPSTAAVGPARARRSAGAGADAGQLALLDGLGRPACRAAAHSAACAIKATGRHDGLTRAEAGVVLVVHVGPLPFGRTPSGHERRRQLGDVLGQSGPGVRAVQPADLDQPTSPFCSPCDPYPDPPWPDEQREAQPEHGQPDRGQRDRHAPGYH